MHRHTRIHTKEAELSALGGGKASQKRSKAAWKPRSNYCVQTVNDSGFDSPLGLSAEMTQSSMMVKSLPKEDGMSVKMKRPPDSKDSLDWSVPAKRPCFPEELPVTQAPLSIEENQQYKAVHYDSGTPQVKKTSVLVNIICNLL